MTDFSEINPILKEDFEYIKKNFDWNPFFGKTVMITGAGGFLGGILAKSILFSTENTKVIGIVRNIEKAKEVFKDFHSKMPEFIVQNIENPIETEEKADFIIHAASETSSKNFYEKPVQTIETTVNGTQNILKYALKSGAQGVVFLSSMEIYGAEHSNDEKIAENAFSTIDTMNPRSSYPESKRICETLCAAYAKEYGLRAMSARLTQIFGAGMDFNDSRVIMQFIRQILAKNDLVLHTDGSSAKNYCYSADAVLAILTILAKGKPAEAYNVAAEGTYCSIKELAQILVKKYPESSLKFEKNSGEIYFPKCAINLDTQKIEKLGWKPKFSIDEMLDRTIKYFASQQERKIAPKGTI